MNRRANGFLALMILVILIAVVAVGATFFSSHVQTYEVTGTVKHKWIDVSEEGSHYMVRLTDGTLLEVQRNIWYSGVRYNPDRIFTDLEIGETYRFTCWGWQVDFWMIYWYPNIIEAEEI